MIVHIQADQLLTQFIIDRNKILCLHNTGTLDIYMMKFDAEKYFLTKWHFFLHVFKRVYDCAVIGHTQFFLRLGILTSFLY